MNCDKVDELAGCYFYSGSIIIYNYLFIYLFIWLDAYNTYPLQNSNMPYTIKMYARDVTTGDQHSYGKHIVSWEEFEF